MDPRPKLQQLLKSLFEDEPHVYHQPPEDVKLKYPCIVYHITGMPDKYADNRKYLEHRKYQLTVIDPDPDSVLRERVAKLKRCRFVRPFVKDNLYHYIFTLYFH